MLHLSPEIYDQIVSKLEFSVPYDKHNISRSMPNGYDILKYYHHTGIGHARNGIGKPDVPTLCNLRLTSKAFHQAATRVLFRTTRAILNTGEIRMWRAGRCTNARAITFGDIERSILNSVNTIPISSVIKNLKLDFTSSYGHDDNFTLDSVTANAAALSLTSRLPAVLEQLTNLRSFEIWSPTRVSIYDGGDRCEAPQLDLNVWDTLTANLAKALTFNTLEHLTELRLVLSCTHDFSTLSSSLSSKICNQLKSLHLEITDATGPGGSKKYLYWADEDSDGDSNFPFSNLQKRNPNVDQPDSSDSESDLTTTSGSEASFFHLASRCPNLELLGLGGTQVLDGNLLTWQPSGQGLTDLYLSRIKISAESLVKILSPDPLSESRLARIWFEDVELNAGTWEQVFKHLMQCKSLVYIRPLDLTYTRDSESVHLRAWGSRLWEDSRTIWSEEASEEEPLHDLGRMLVDRAGGRENYPDSNYELMFME